MSVELSDLFAEIWKSCSDESDVRAFLDQHSQATGEQRLSIVLFDQTQRWKCGKPRSAEAYLAEFPDLDFDATAKLRLIVGEFQACQEFNGSMTAQDLIARFPELSEQILEELSRRDLTCPQPLPQLAFNSFFSDSTQTEYKNAGRYRLLEILGEGAFGQVWLALDEDLRRKVAVKLARPDSLPRPEESEKFLEEARLLAGLNHPNIVRVLDVGRSDGRVYIVFDFVDGKDLAKVLKSRMLEFREAAELIATVATALHYAHTNGVIHRDVKPSNLLIAAKTQLPFVADFGLAVRETDFAETAKLAGTPRYMSPEQARGESHRMDARCDVFALGAVLYEVLTGTPAFRGSTKDEILIQVVQKDPPAPRQINGQIPFELERICLKALSKRIADRYCTAQEMAEDLQMWLSPKVALTLADDSGSMVPKGLRSFDSNDAHFFLSLVPGPRNRYGLPESIAFWKERIEETDPEQTFSVGLIYGPSGCGKSSLIKAGLLPCLSRSISIVYVEATADDTEARIIQGVRSRVPELARDKNLVDTLGSVRRSHGGKVLIVIDQFEQWLHAHRTETEPELVTALRQCDGIRLQAIVMVRDDFWLAVSRLMDQVEIELKQGINIRLVDLFDIDHAVKVLTCIGQAYQKIPASIVDLSGSQREFLRKASEGLAEDGRVVSVRLALFGEMVKGKPWEPETLADMGGTEGIGIAFLEEAFSSRFANPKHRQHQQAARAVLSALLPQLGTNIKGHMRSQQELQDAAGLKERPQEFIDLLRILDGELRLITPTDSEGDNLNDAALATRYYQLTHDYLVPSLREWLTRKQRETRKGRAELKLEERSGIWNSRPENKQLPTLSEWFTIRVLTSSTRWTTPQRIMMGKAAKVHLAFWGRIWLTLLLTGFGIQQWTVSERKSNLRQQTQTVIESLQNNLGPSISVNLKELRKLPQELVLPELQTRFTQTQDAKHKLSLAFALANYGQLDENFLVSQIDAVAETDTGNFITALQTNPKAALAVLRIEGMNCIYKASWRRKARVAITALALGDSDLAVDVCAFEHRRDQEQRTLFIDEFRHWSVDLPVVLAAVRNCSSPALRSGICLAIGQIPVATINELDKEAWSTLASHWFASQPDTSTHSAAGWLLRQWQVDYPEISTLNEIIPQRDWFENSAGATMLRIRPGKFRQVTSSDLHPMSREVIVKKEFWVADREVTRGQFERFMNDAQYPATEKPVEISRKSYEGGTTVSPTAHHPAHRMNRYDAIKYCNWLSIQEGRSVCYERTGTKEKNGYSDEEHEAWRCETGGTGYRLLFDGEWEFACRAGAETPYTSGDTEPLLVAYSQMYPSQKTSVCGEKLPNAWGLHDMHGNVKEWCWDMHPMSKPGDQSIFYVSRGGWYGLDATSCSAVLRINEVPVNWQDGLGFRIALSPTGVFPGEYQEIDAEAPAVRTKVFNESLMQFQGLVKTPTTPVVAPPMIASLKGWSGCVSPDGAFAILNRDISTPSDGGALLRLNLGGSETFKLIDGGRDGMWSWDGKRIACCSGRNGTTEIAIVGNDGVEGMRRYAGYMPHWSNDGKVLFFSNLERRSLMRVPLDCSDPKPEVLVPDVSDPFAQVSPDMQRICHVEKWQNDLIVEDPSTGKKFAAIPIMGMSPLMKSWNLASTHVAFGGFKDHGIWILNAYTGECKKVLEGTYVNPRWSADGKRISVDNRPKNVVEIYDLSEVELP